MLERNGYPAGVPCWVDIVQPDLDATKAFYGGLFGWEYQVRTPPAAPSQYVYARKDGLIVAGVGGPPSADDPPGWTTYVWVDSADATAAAVVANGGRVLRAPVDLPRAGRVALCADSSGAKFGIWQAAENRGVQLVNAPGSWNFSDLTTDDAGEAQAFYGAVFGWECDPFELTAVERHVLRRRRGGRLRPGRRPGGDGRHPLFDTDYSRMGTVRDPQGGVLTLSEYRPPSR